MFKGPIEIEYREAFQFRTVWTDGATVFWLWDNIYSLHVSSCRLAVITPDMNIFTLLRQSPRLERANDRASLEIGCAENGARPPLMSRPLSWTIEIHSQGAAYLTRRKAMNVVLYHTRRSWMSTKQSSSTYDEFSVVYDFGTTKTATCFPRASA